MVAAPLSSKKFCVYVYRDPRPFMGLRPIYVGKGNIKNKRAEKHWRVGACNPLLARLFAKFKNDGLVPIIEIVDVFEGEADAFACEKALIAKFGRRDQGNGPLANMTDGGDGNSNPSLEKRARLAEAAAMFHGGRSKTAEHRARIGAAHKGRKQSPDAVEKSRAARIGIKLSDETKARMSAVRRGKPKTGEWKLKAKSWLHNPDVDARRAAGVRTPEARAKISESSKRMWERRRETRR